MNFILNCFFLFIVVFGFGQSYSTYNPKGIAFAKDAYHNHKESFKKIGCELGLSSAFIFSIVAPEVSNYNSLTNFIELSGLKLVYIQSGSNYGNFSIGQFQMKPSFIEKLEIEICKYPDLKKKYAHLKIGGDGRSSRRIRLERMESYYWQLKYLEAFCAMIQKKNQTFKNTEEKLKFYATSYNTGFHKSIKQVESEYYKKRFPAISNQKFNYSDVALFFFKEV